jgi:ABC-type lipoprotein release transport system permease subunit
MVLVGLAFGIAGAWAAGHAVQSFLFEVKALDSMTILATTALLLVVSGAAAFFPAMRAAKVDPVETLRAE